MQNIGVALVSPAGVIEQQWDSLPTVITHAGENRTGAIVGAEFSGGYLLVNRVCEDPPPGNCPVLSSTSAYNGSHVIVTQTYGPPDLAAERAVAKRQISAAAEQERLRYITEGSGKAMSYQKVAAEAIRYGATNGAGSYPFLKARVASGRYPNLSTAAAATQQIEAQWAAVGSAIDQVEDAAKLAIDAATTIDQIQAATQVTWP